MSKLLLIDGDVLQYRCAFAAQHNWYYVYDDKGKPDKIIKDGKKEADRYIEEHPGFSYKVKLKVEPVANALHSCKHMINGMLGRFKTDNIKIYLTGDGNFREQIGTLAPYKGNRNKEICDIYGKKCPEKPVHYNAVRDYLIEFWDAEIIVGMEADDQMAIEQTRHNRKAARAYKKNKGSNIKELANSIICTIDKDLKQVPGWHYDFVTDELVWVNTTTGLRNLYAQIIAGDTVDNIPGIPRVGIATAMKMFGDAKSEEKLAEIALQAWCKYAHAIGGHAQDAVDMMYETAQLVYMKRSPDDEYKFPGVVIDG